MPTIWFHDGPCDLTKQAAGKATADDTIVCQGTTYALISRPNGDFIAIPHDETVNTTFGLPGVGAGSIPDVLKTADALSAWNAFAVGLTRTLPAALKDARDATRRIGQAG